MHIAYFSKFPGSLIQLSRKIFHLWIRIKKILDILWLLTCKFFSVSNEYSWKRNHLIMHHYVKYKNERNIIHVAYKDRLEAETIISPDNTINQEKTLEVTEMTRKKLSIKIQVWFVSVIQQ
jgi:hypothetical protein